MPHSWQVRFNRSGTEPIERIHVPVAADIIDELLGRIPDFGRAYEPDGLTVDEFDSFGPTVRTLRIFITGYHDLQAAVRDIVLPNPELPAD
jgi:transaldolase